MPRPPKTQRDQRRDINAVDQHGRIWITTIELETGDPTGGIHPAGWEDPLRTPQQYLKVPKDQFGQTAWGKMSVEFAPWIRNHRQADRDWRRSLLQIGANLYKNKFDPKTAADDEYLIELAGPQPWPPVAVLEAAKNGDRRYLGLDPLDADARRALRMDTVEDLEAQFAAGALPGEGSTGNDGNGDAPSAHLSWPEFMAIHRKLGHDLPDIQQRWKDYKASFSNAE